jgi:hypothetical protein
MASNAVNPLKVELGLLDDLVNANMEAGTLLVIQKEVSNAMDRLEQSKKLNSDGLAKAKKGLDSAKILGDERTIKAFSNWVSTFTKDIARADKAMAQLKSVNIGF